MERGGTRSRVGGLGKAKAEGEGKKMVVCSFTFLYIMAC